MHPFNKELMAFQGTFVNEKLMIVYRQTQLMIRIEPFVICGL